MMRINFLILTTLLLVSCSSENQNNSLVEHLNNETGENWQVESVEKRELEEVKEKLVELTNEVEMLTKMSKTHFNLENQVRESLNLEPIPETIHTNSKSKNNYLEMRYGDSPNKDLLLRADSSIQTLKKYYYIRSKSLDELLVKIQN